MPPSRNCRLGQCLSKFHRGYKQLTGSFDCPNKNAIFHGFSLESDVETEDKLKEVQSKKAKLEKEITDNKLLQERLDHTLKNATPDNFQSFENNFVRLRGEGSRLSNELTELRDKETDLKKEARSM